MPGSLGFGGLAISSSAVSRSKRGCGVFLVRSHWPPSRAHGPAGRWRSMRATRGWTGTRGGDALKRVGCLQLTGEGLRRLFFFPLLHLEFISSQKTEKRGGIVVLLRGRTVLDSLFSWLLASIFSSALFFSTVDLSPNSALRISPLLLAVVSIPEVPWTLCACLLYWSCRHGTRTHRSSPNSDPQNLQHRPTVVPKAQG